MAEGDGGVLVFLVEAGSADLVRGALLARGGATVVTGGLGGVMQAASKGALGAGGLTIGFLPGQDSSEANEYVRAAPEPLGMKPVIAGNE